MPQELSSNLPLLPSISSRQSVCFVSFACGTCRFLTDGIEPSEYKNTSVVLWTLSAIARRVAGKFWKSAFRKVILPNDCLDKPEAVWLSWHTSHSRSLAANLMGRQEKVAPWQHNAASSLTFSCANPRVAGGKIEIFNIFRLSFKTRHINSTAKIPPSFEPFFHLIEILILPTRRKRRATL